MIHLDLPATLRHLSIISACLSELLEQVSEITATNEISYNVQLAVHEVCTNIVDHAYRGQVGRLKISMILDYAASRLIVELVDYGISFNPNSVLPPTLGELQERGFGLFIVKEIMDEVHYQTTPDENRWRLVKNLS